MCLNWTKLQIEWSLQLGIFSENCEEWPGEFLCYFYWQDTVNCHEPTIHMSQAWCFFNSYILYSVIFFNSYFHILYLRILYFFSHHISCSPSPSLLHAFPLCANIMIGALGGCLSFYNLQSLFCKLHSEMRTLRFRETDYWLPQCHPQLRVCWRATSLSLVSVAFLTYQGVLSFFYLESLEMR